MAYTSTRYLPIRAKIISILQANATLLADVKAWPTTQLEFEHLEASQLPAVGVWFAENIGQEIAPWASPYRDHEYNLQLHIGAFHRTPPAAEDLCISYLELVEDVLRSQVQPVLAGASGTVREMKVTTGNRVMASVEGGWYVRAWLGVTVRKSVTA